MSTEKVGLEEFVNRMSGIINVGLEGSIIKDGQTPTADQIRSIEDEGGNGLIKELYANGHTFNSVLTRLGYIPRRHTDITQEKIMQEMQTVIDNAFSMRDGKLVRVEPDYEGFIIKHVGELPEKKMLEASPEYRWLVGATDRHRGYFQGLNDLFKMLGYRPNKRARFTIEELVSEITDYLRDQGFEITDYLRDQGLIDGHGNFTIGAAGYLTREKLLKNGRYDLVSAVQRYGGFIAIKQQMRIV